MTRYRLDDYLLSEDGTRRCEHVPEEGPFSGWGWIFRWGPVRLWTCRRRDCWPNKCGGRSQPPHPWFQAIEIFTPRSNSRESLRYERTALYRHYDAAGGLLYVGITRDPDVRLKQHLVGPFGHQIVDTKIEWFPTRVEAEKVESAAIRDESPEYNVRGRP